MICRVEYLAIGREAKQRTGKRKWKKRGDCRDRKACTVAMKNRVWNEQPSIALSMQIAGLRISADDYVA